MPPPAVCTGQMGHVKGHFLIALPFTCRPANHFSRQSSKKSRLTNLIVRWRDTTPDIAHVLGNTAVFLGFFRHECAIAIKLSTNI